MWWKSRNRERRWLRQKLPVAKCQQKVAKMRLRGCRQNRPRELGDYPPKLCGTSCSKDLIRILENTSTTSCSSYLSTLKKRFREIIGSQAYAWLFWYAREWYLAGCPLARGWAAWAMGTEARNYSRSHPNSTKWARFCDHNNFLITTPIIKLFLIEI